jgi:excinuclease ABC subunit C
VTLARPPAGTIPETPGSYQFKDRDGRVIYVGKAKSLRSRLSNYFVDPRSLPPRTAQMVASAESVEWIEVRNEVEALMLEYSLIKQHRPRFNIRLRDDKSYPFLAITLDDEWPRAMVMRGQKRKGVRYFGPFGHAYAIRETLDLLLRTFPIRTCSDNKFQRHERQGRPCLLFHIEKCSGPCVREVTSDEYAALVADLVRFLEGETGPVVRRLETAMKDAAGRQEYELAARMRDRLASVRKAIEKQAMVTERSEDIDVIGLAEDELEAAVQVFYVRRGRVTGRKGFVIDKVEDLSRSELMAHVIEQLYAESALDVPREVLVPDLPDDAEFYEEWLTLLRDGRRASVRVPQRGDKRALQEMVTRNASEEFVRHRLRRSADHNSRARALTALQDELGLPDAPLRIECFDMSHIQGSDYVGSMVVMEDALPKKSEYRRFKVKTVEGNDDYAAMEEVLTRRFTALLAERDRGLMVDDGTDAGGYGYTGRSGADFGGEASRSAAGAGVGVGPGSAAGSGSGSGSGLGSGSGARSGSGRPRKFSYPPQLLLIDGGKGQLGVALRVLEELGLDDEIPVASLAKQFEEVYLPGRADPVRIPRQSEALYLLQRIRDEAHRFAITYHRQLRGKRMTKSVLDDVPGLGPTRKKRLIKEFGGVAAVKKASFESLAALPWLPEAVARALYDKLHGVPAA